MPTEGEITVRLAWNGHGIGDVRIESTRPFVAGRILNGKPAEAAAAIVPKLFAVCGGAQGAAAISALAAAGATDAGADIARHENGVILEAIQEYFWRLLIDWPQAMGETPNPTPVAAVRHRIAAAARTADGRSLLGDRTAMRHLGAELSRLAAQSVFGAPPSVWLEIATLPGLDAWTARGATPCARMLRTMRAEMPTLGRSNVLLMPPPSRDALLAVVAPAMDRDSDYAKAPTWNGVPVETGALARVHAHPLVAALTDAIGQAATTRFVARLVDLASLVTEFAGAPPRDDALPWVQAFAAGSSCGLAAVQTSRGLLVHRVRVDGRLVADYRIVAPTEWNFHPQGALAAGLAGIAANSERELKAQAELAVQALDPCVACRVEVVDA